MKRALQIGIAAVVCFGSVAVYTQSPQSPSGFPADDTAYKSSFVPKLPTPGPDMRITDDATARREWMRERMGGELSPQFMDAMLDAVRVQRAQYPAALVSGGAGSWTNVGPVRSNWIENGGRLTISDTGRLRTILVPHQPGHRLSADIRRRAVEDDQLPVSAA
jgi:hypothetical protein